MTARHVRDIAETITGRWYFPTSAKTVEKIVYAVLDELAERERIADRIVQALVASSDGE